MKTDQWLDSIARKLRRAGLPGHYVQRTICELADHANLSGDETRFRRDLTVESSQALADEFVVGFRTSRWYRRVPSCLWVLFPIPLGLAVCLSYYITGIAVIESSTDALDGKPHTGLKSLLLPWLFYVGQFVTPLLAIYLLQNVMTKIGRPAWVRYAALAALTFFFMATTTDYRVATTDEGGHLHLNFSDESLEQLTLLSWSMLQVLIIWVVCCLDFVRSRRTSGMLRWAS